MTAPSIKRSSVGNNAKFFITEIQHDKGYMRPDPSSALELQQRAFHPRQLLQRHPYRNQAPAFQSPDFQEIFVESGRQSSAVSFE